MQQPSGSIEDLLNSAIDAVYVASPVNMHLEHGSRISKTQGNMFFSEKTSWVECRRS